MTELAKRVFTNATADTTSLQYRHNTRGPECLIMIEGTMGGAKVTPWMTIDEDLPKVALNGISYTTATIYKLTVTRNALIELRITDSTGTTDINATIAPVEGY